MTEHTAKLAGDIEACSGSPKGSSTRCASSCGRPPWVLETIGQTRAAEKGGSAIGIMLARGRPNAWSAPAAQAAFHAAIVATKIVDVELESPRRCRAGFARHQHLLVEFLQRLAIEPRRGRGIVIARLANGAGRAPFGVQHQHRGDSRIGLRHRVVKAPSAGNWCPACTDRIRS